MGTAPQAPTMGLSQEGRPGPVSRDPVLSLDVDVGPGTGSPVAVPHPVASAPRGPWGRRERQLLVSNSLMYERGCRSSPGITRRAPARTWGGPDEGQQREAGSLRTRIDGS